MKVSNIKVSNPLSRKHLLKGGATTLGLPFLDAMVPVYGQSKTQAPKRFVAICATLGFHTPYLIPTETGSNYRMTPYLEKIKSHRKKFTVCSGICHPQQQGNNGHASELTWLTSAQRPGLAGFKNSISIDQLIANEIGHLTRFPYMVLTTGGRSMSWNSTGVELPAERSAAKLYQQMFVAGTPKQIAEEMKKLERGKSIMDTVLRESKKLESKLGSTDRRKLDEYTSSIRALEKRLTQSQDWVQREKPKTDTKPLKDVTDKSMSIEKQDLMYETMALALQSDSTRTITFQISGMNGIPQIPGVKTDWHNLSHHGKDPEKIEELSLIEKAKFVSFNKFLNQLESKAEMGKSLLDHSAILFGSNLGNASSHDWHNLPIVLAGGRFKHAGHIAGDVKNNTPFANLLVGMAQHMGLGIDKFGSSTRAGLKGLDLV